MKLLIMLSLLLTSQAFASDELGPMLIGGQEVKPGEYPEVVRIRSCDGGRCSGCTAAVVGPRVILSAGHCMKDGGTSEFQLGQNQYKAECTHHPLYPDTEDMDMALCKTDKPMDVKFAHVSKEGPAIADVVTLIGYGCIREGGGGGNDGILRVGEAPVTRLPQGSNNWYYTQDDTALCFGDSGGPSFKRVRNPKGETHYILGVNSRGNIRDLSLLTAIYLDKGVEFMERYERDNDVKICGLSGKCGESGEGEPEPEPKPECKRENRKVKYYSYKLDKWQKRLERCEQEEKFTSLVHPVELWAE